MTTQTTTDILPTITSSAPPAKVLVKGLALGVLALVLAGVVTSVLGLILTGSFWIVEQFSWLTPETLTKGRSAMVPVLSFLAVAVGMWAGVYTVSVKRSALLSFGGLVIGGGVGFLLYSLGSPLWSLGMLGVGWAVAVPASSLRTAAIRAIPSAVLGFMTLGVSAVLLREKFLFIILGAAIAAAIVVLMVTLVDPLVQRRE